MFNEFLNIYYNFFLIEKREKAGHGVLSSKMVYDLHKDCKFYSWSDKEYREMMVTILLNLEPRYESKGTYILKVLDEVSEMTFVMNGKIAVGYEINKIKKYPVQY